MTTDGENSVLAVKGEWRIHNKWFIQLHGSLSLLREYAWLEIQFPIVFFILETDCDQHDTSIFFYLMFKIWPMLAISEKSQSAVYLHFLEQMLSL